MGLPTELKPCPNLPVDSASWRFLESPTAPRLKRSSSVKTLLFSPAKPALGIGLAPRAIEALQRRCSCRGHTQSQ